MKPPIHGFILGRPQLFWAPIDIFQSIARGGNAILRPLDGLCQAGPKKKLNKRPRRRKMQRAGIGFIIAFFVIFIGTLVANHSKPYKQYYELHQQAEAGEIDTEISATFPPILYGYRKTGFKSLEKPSAQHWLGVDQSTRDVAVQMLYGTRIALSIGVIAVSIYVAIGIVIGSIAGFFGRIVDLLIVRMIEIFMAVPRLIVILTLLAFIDNASIFHIMLVIGLLGWTGLPV